MRSSRRERAAALTVAVGPWWRLVTGSDGDNSWGRRADGEILLEKVILKEGNDGIVVRFFCNLQCGAELVESIVRSAIGLLQESRERWTLLGDMWISNGCQSRSHTSVACLPRKHQTR